jgi:hypothetical protein
MPKYLCPADPFKLRLRKIGKYEKYRRVPPAIVVPACQCRDTTKGETCPECGYRWPVEPRSERLWGQFTGRTLWVPVAVPHPRYRGKQAVHYLHHHPRYEEIGRKRFAR